MRVFFLFILALNTGCQLSSRIRPSDCQNLSSLYTQRLGEFEDLNSFTSWKELSSFHSRIFSVALGSWEQENSHLSEFSDYFISSLRTKVWLQCGFFTEEETAPQVVVQKDPQKPTLNRVFYTPTPFQSCVLNEWKASEDLIFKSCMLYLSE